MNVLLNILGIGFVLYAIFLLKKDKKSRKADDIFKESGNVSNFEEFDADEFIEEINSFSKILDEKKKSEEYSKSNITDDDTYIPSTNLEKEIDTMEDPGYGSLVKDISKKSNESNMNEINKKVLDLNSIGLSDREIAKQMGRSIREIEIILKLYNKNKI